LKNIKDISRVVDERGAKLEDLLFRHTKHRDKWVEAEFEAGKIKKVIAAVNRSRSQKARHYKMAKLKKMVELGSGQKKCKKAGKLNKKMVEPAAARRSARKRALTRTLI
jgi:hypothetical protein